MAAGKKGKVKTDKKRARGADPAGRPRGEAPAREKAASAAGRAKEPAAGAVRRRQAAWFAERLAETYPDATIALTFRNPYELYVATVLSAQCTDVRVNMVTPELFREAPTPDALLEMGSERLERRIQSTGFFRNKTKSLRGGAARMVEAYGGRVPETMEELLTVPGVGRKTANVILGNAFGRNEGFVVDTHVARVSHRLGLTRHTEPEKIEQDLMAVFPQDDWTILAHRLIHHGRQICIARRPKCEICPLAERCPYGIRFLAALGRAAGAPPARGKPSKVGRGASRPSG